jgi:hypothetical protein
MAKRTINKKGEPLPQKAIDKSNPVLFGAYPFEVDKKQIIWEKVADLEPRIAWLYDNKGLVKKENYDMTDSYVCCYSKMKMDGIWK